MASGDVVVVGVGMVTAVGLSAPETAAAVRAGTMRFGEIPFMDRQFEPFTVAEVPEEGLEALAEPLEGLGLTSRDRRMLRLAARSLKECLRGLPEGEPPPPLELALPEMVTTRELNEAGFLGWLAAQAGPRFDAARSGARHRGRAGGLAAIGRAVARIRSGEARFAIAGGVDSYRDTYVLGTLDLQGRVKSTANLDGFIPGEGAGFVLLAARSAAEAAGVGFGVAVSATAEAFEPGHMYSDQPYRGDGLAQALALLAGQGLGPAGEVFSSMNGESHWAKEWGVAYLRNRGLFSADHGMHHPADCFGDTGAACGPLMVGLTALGIRDGYLRTPGLVYASSDQGARTALMVYRC